MNLHDVIERFTLVSGLTGSEVSRFLPLIVDCKEFFSEQIGSDLSVSQLKRAAHACAVYAYYRVCLMLRDGGTESFKAGDVQISSSKLGELCDAARRMWDEERTLVADIADFGGDGFAFRSVCV